MTYRLSPDLLALSLGVSERTIRRWIADGLNAVGPDGCIDDMEAQSVRDVMRTRRAAHLRRGACADGPRLA